MIGPLISDNSVTFAISSTPPACRACAGPAPCASAASTCFTVANGDIPTESVMCANWCRQQGHRRSASSGSRAHPATATPTTSGAAAAEPGVDIIKEVCLGPNPRNLADQLDAMRALGRRSRRLRRIRLLDLPLRQGVPGAGLGPAPDHGHRIHVLLELQRMGEGLDGWHGIDQLGEDGKPTRTTRPCWPRFQARFGRTVEQRGRRALPTTRPGSPCSASRTPDRHAPATSRPASRRSSGCRAPTAGRRRYVTFAPYDHRGLQGRLPDHP